MLILCTVLTPPKRIRKLGHHAHLVVPNPQPRRPDRRSLGERSESRARISKVCDWATVLMGASPPETPAASRRPTRARARSGARPPTPQPDPPVRLRTLAGAVRGMAPDTRPILRSARSVVDLMAIGHCHVTLYSRGRRRPPTSGYRANTPPRPTGSVVVRPAAAAVSYRFGVALTDPRTGVRYDHSHREDIIGEGIVAPSSRETPITASPQALVDAIEAAERRRDSQLFRDVTVSVPHELVEALGPDAATALLERYAQRVSDRYDTVVGWVGHGPGEGDPRNTHGHLMVSTRRLDANGQLGEKIRELATYTKSGAEVAWMKNTWAEMANQALKDAGLEARVHVGRRLDRAPVPTLTPQTAGPERRRRRRKRRDEYLDLVDGDRARADAMAANDLRRAAPRLNSAQDAEDEDRARLRLRGLGQMSDPVASPTDLDPGQPNSPPRRRTGGSGATRRDHRHRPLRPQSPIAPRGLAQDDKGEESRAHQRSATPARHGQTAGDRNQRTPLAHQGGPPGTTDPTAAAKRARARARNPACQTATPYQETPPAHEARPPGTTDPTTAAKRARARARDPARQTTTPYQETPPAHEARPPSPTDGAPEKHARERPPIRHRAPRRVRAALGSRRRSRRQERRAPLRRSRTIARPRPDRALGRSRRRHRCSAAPRHQRLAQLVRAPSRPSRRRLAQSGADTTSADPRRGYPHGDF